MISIKLISSSWPKPSGTYANHLILHYNNWDDYGYKTTFFLNYYDRMGTVHEIGDIKIYFKGYDKSKHCVGVFHTRHTIKNPLITQLGSDFCSLGQELSYYKNLQKYLPNEYKEVLKRLNDIACFPEIKELFSDEDAVRDSLLRSSGARKAMEKAWKVLAGVKEFDDIVFDYKLQMPYSTVPTVFSFDFQKNDFLQHRINVLIGKNGTGKTQLLAKLAEALMEARNDEDFPKGRPPIDRIISISFSAFDDFKKPNQVDSKQFSYIYCGIQRDNCGIDNKAQDENRLLTSAELSENYLKARNKIYNLDRQGIWQEIISVLIEPEYQQYTTNEVDAAIVDYTTCDYKEYSNKWSSGQRILIYAITQLIAYIEDESLILFDEPEIHLHPNAMANLMKKLFDLLEKFKSYAILSTHSPIIVQEIPKKYIQVLSRYDNVLTVRTPRIECFGSNISDIITDIFDVKSEENNYKSLLSKLSEQLSFDEINSLFGNNLSFNALVYLKTCYKGENNHD